MTIVSIFCYPAGFAAVEAVETATTRSERLLEHKSAWRVFMFLNLFEVPVKCMVYGFLSLSVCFYIIQLYDPKWMWFVWFVKKIKCQKQN